MANPSDIFVQLKAMWGRLTIGQRLGFGSTLVFVVGGLAAAMWWSARPDWQVVGTGLSAKETQKIITLLKSEKINHTVGSDGTIQVNAPDMERVHAAMAAAGLRAGGTGTIEEDDENALLKTAMDKNERAFAQARQIEKRLAQRIMQFDFIENATVTITPAGDKFYRQGQTEAKASVQVKTTMPLSETQIESIVHTIAGGVEKLSPENVAVVDTNGVVLRQPARGDTPGVRAPDMSRQVAIEKHKEAQAQQTLDLVFGPRKVAVTVSAEIDWDRIQNKETKYDPENVAIIEKQNTTNSRQNSTAVSGGRPTTAAAANGANIADGSKGNEQKDSTTKETRKYGMTEVEMVKMGGAIKRLSVGVFIDESLKDRVDMIKTTIGAAVGLDPKRGDMIETAMTSFAKAPDDAAPSAKDGAEKKSLILAYARYGVWGFVGVLFIFFALRTIKKAQRTLHEVLERSVEEEKSEDKPVAIEEQILSSVKKDTELAGRSLRRWLYENASV